MAAKLVQVRPVGGSTWYTLPGNTADFNVTKNQVDESVFGTDFVANLPTLKSWTGSGNAMIRGVPGYYATIKRAGSPTAVTGGSLDNEVSGGYYTSNRAQSLWDNEATTTIYDDSVAVAASDIEYIDYLQGGVVFKSTYTVTGVITADFSYRGTTPICSFTGFDLGQTLNTEDVTDFCSANDNGGWSIFAPQQKEVDLTLDGFFSLTEDYLSEISSDDYVVVELSLIGDDSTVARGYYRVSDLSQSGDVGSTETVSLSYALAVPNGVKQPFSFYIADNSVMPEAIKVCLEAWQSRVPVEWYYQEDGATSYKTGEAYVTDASLSNSVSDMNSFSVSFQGTGAVTEV